MNFLQCQDRSAELWMLLAYYIQCMIPPESGFTAFWTVSISWSGQYNCANSLNISIQTFCVIGFQKDHRKGHFMLSNIEQITGYRYLCVSGHHMDHRTDHKADC